ncbi:cobyric acid synthase [Peribacillus simplex]|uniref:Cobyric acid synthase n=2 Tax=Peribacillus simplex TaxID=1478 RepID=A0A223EBM3_9BACI|nr:cobyric acid synthase [Peribacillus simplex]ASS92654.1 cobyric acid synthase CobQ [Peribacillus simplex NBRC 15720 = DSM 1321]MEC1398334.1 cobyric acid synthase [Peribacillus simplex]MED3911679.1 cobyric acid synthase [Peribacillus simplex]MED3986836.1 cobyric acid synthase [Peribacillus simplex]MED4094772.1 cobyric acid synthase [Peribacillus simplex]
MKARSIMIQGTSSDVGKSLICTAFCRVFSNKGLRVVPFKSQNMALNSYVTLDGGEIGRAQGVQAEAARITATTDMNPILLKPKQDMVSEVIVHGKHFLDMNAKSYRSQFVQEAMPIIRKSVEKLQDEYDIIVLEGAGSPAEINLKDRDIANMRMAKLTDAAVILVADIDRGGVFASIIGTLALLDQDERDRVKGIIINKFRGMRELLDDGIEWVEKETGIPVLGVLPYLDVNIEAEDSLALSSLRFKKPKKAEFPIDVAVLRFPRISNFTDVDPFFDEPGVGVRLVSSVHELGNPDLLILPGTKNTMEDLEWLNRMGLGRAINELRKQGTLIFGICGGFQMLGTKLFDPDAVEGDGENAEGLSLLPVETVFQAEKKTVQMEGVLSAGIMEGQMNLNGFEIHLGRTTLKSQVRPFLLLKDGREDGAISNDNKVMGTYLHGIFHNRLFTRLLVNQIRRNKGLDEVKENVQSDSERREEAYNLLASHLEENIDMDTIYQWLQLETTES